MDMIEKCDCTMPEAASYHDSDCDLWSNPDFSWGSLYWDATDKTLREIGPDGIQPHLTATETEEWDDEWEDDGRLKSNIIDVDSWDEIAEGHKWTPCRHAGHAVTFPDGTTIWASSLHHRKDGDPMPEFGCYMASGWEPEWISFYLTWADQRLPRVPMAQVLWMVDYLLELARQGRVVEIGCIGGHGRTGTLMAVMALKAGAADAQAARDFVRRDYCKQAIESDIQEWYVDAVDAHLKGLPIPEQPEEPCWYSEHRKLYEEFKVCTKKVCKESWPKDLENLSKPKVDYNQACSLPEHREKWDAGKHCWKQACKALWEKDVKKFEIEEALIPDQDPARGVQQQQKESTQ